MTASQLSTRCDTPTSTTRRTFERLTDASTPSGRPAVRTGGHHTAEYGRALEGVTVFLDGDRRFEETVTRPTRSVDEQLAGLRAAVRRET